MYVNEYLIESAKLIKTFNLMPFGDLQAGSPVFCREKWNEYLSAVAAKTNVITIGMGDYSDHFRPTIQGRLRAALDRESSATLDDLHRKHIRQEVLPLLKPVIKKSICLGLLGGHHDMTYADGTNSTQYLCQLLGIAYLGDGEAMLRVHLKFSKCNFYKFDLWATHGDGNGGAVGSNIAKLQRMLAHMDADILLRGHSCDKFIFQEPHYYLTGKPPRLRQRNRIIANTGSFSDGRAEKETTYVEKKNLAPKALGWVEIHLNVVRDPENRNSHMLKMGD